MYPYRTYVNKLVCPPNNLIQHYNSSVLRVPIRSVHSSGSVRPNIGFARSWTFGTKLDFRDREVGLFLWSYLDLLAIPKIQLRDIPTTKVQLRSSKLMFLPASFRTDFVVHYYVDQSIGFQRLTRT